MGAWFAGKGPQWEYAQAERDSMELERQKTLQELDKERKAALLTDFSNVYWYLDDNNVPMAIKLLKQRSPLIKQLGGDSSDTDTMLNLLESGKIDEVKQELELFLKSGGIPTTDKLTNFKPMSDGSIWGYNERKQEWQPTKVQPGTSMPSPADGGGNNFQFGPGETFKGPDGRFYMATQKRNPMTGQVESVFSEVPEGYQMVGQMGLTASEQVNQKGAEAGAVEGAKLGAQLNLGPKVKAAVEQAKALAISEVKRGDEQRSNGRALATYEAAMGKLSSAMEGTSTGPVVGLSPAVTANQQIAKGAVAAMAPVLKSIFRVAGEGTFTDKDQELLLNMVPTRQDLPEARKAKIEMIDAIVRAKLGASGPAQPTAPTGQPTESGGLSPQEQAELERLRSKFRGGQQ